MKFAKGCLPFLQSGWIETESGSKHRLHKHWPAWELHFFLVSIEYLVHTCLPSIVFFACFSLFVLLASSTSSLMSLQTLTNTDRNLCQHTKYASSNWDGAMLEIVWLDLLSDCKLRSVKGKLKCICLGFSVCIMDMNNLQGDREAFRALCCVSACLKI